MNKRIYGDSITERPEWINNRSQFGHWEIDTVIGVKDKNEPVLLTLTERLTRYELILKIEGKTDRAVKKALQPLMMTELAPEIFKSITADNKNRVCITCRSSERYCEGLLYPPIRIMGKRNKRKP